MVEVRALSHKLTIPFLLFSGNTALHLAVMLGRKGNFAVNEYYSSSYLITVGIVQDLSV
jgi:hypothetical protein